MTTLTLEPKVISLLQEHRTDIIGVHRSTDPKPGQYRVSASTVHGQELVLRTGMDRQTALAYREEAEDCLVSARAGLEYPDPDSIPREIQTPRKPHVTRGMPQPEMDQDNLHLRARRAFNEIDRSTTLKEISAKRMLPIGVWKLIGGAKERPCRMVYWHRIGLDKRGYAHRISYAHYAVDPDRTLCGHPIPSSETHVVTIDGESGPSECHLCLAFKHSGAPRE